MMADMMEPALQPVSTSSTDNEVAHIHHASSAAMNDPYQVEALISDRLMRGYTLLAGACPVCSTPLIKNEMEEAPVKQQRPDPASSFNDPNNIFPILVSSESFEQPFIPVIGVPFCVVCLSHVVTTEQDVDLLETSESFKEKGSILVAMKEDEIDDDDETREDSLTNPAAGDDQQQQQLVAANNNNNNDDASSFNKSISSIMKESETILGRNPMVDPNRFSTALFCGTTASRQMVSSSPVNADEDGEDGILEENTSIINQQQQQQQVQDPYNDVNNKRIGFDGQGVEQEFEDNAFADELEEEDDYEASEAALAVMAVAAAELVAANARPSLTIDTTSAEQDENNQQVVSFDEESYYEPDDDDDEEEDAEVMMVEYSVRRDIATKLMGAKLLEGYTLRDAQCDKCGMPVMETNEGDLTCVVCPVLLKKLAAKPAMSTLLSPLERKAKAFEKRWVQEANHAVEYQATKKEEERRNKLLREAEERMVEQARLAAAEAAEAEVQRELEVSEAMALIEEHHADVQRKMEEIAAIEERQAEMQREMELAELEAIHQAEVSREQELEAKRQKRIKQDILEEEERQMQIARDLERAEVNRQAEMKRELEMAVWKAQRQAEMQAEIEHGEMEARRNAELEREREIAEMESRHLEKIKEIQMQDAARQVEMKRIKELQIAETAHQAQLEIAAQEAHQKETNQEIDREIQFHMLQESAAGNNRAASPHLAIQTGSDLDREITARMLEAPPSPCTVASSGPPSPFMSITSCPPSPFEAEEEITMASPPSPHMSVQNERELDMEIANHMAPASPRGTLGLVEAALSGHVALDSALMEARMYADSKLLAEVKAIEDNRAAEEVLEVEEAQRLYATISEEEARRAENERKIDQLQISEETRRLELLEEQRLVEEALKNERKFLEDKSFRAEAEIEAERQRQIDETLLEAKRLREIEEAREAEMMEEQEMRNAVVQQKAEEEARGVAKLEEEALQKKVDAGNKQKEAERKQLEAERKQLEAQEAERKAVEALEEIVVVKKGLFADAIAQAEADAIAEAEAMFESDGTVEEEIEALQRSMRLRVSVEDLEKERWATLRAEGRSALTRRMMQGWQLNDDLCKGEHCMHSPIVEKNRTPECVVCGGSGSGKDGVYAVEVVEKEIPEAVAPEDDSSMEDTLEVFTKEVETPEDAPEDFPEEDVSEENTREIITLEQDAPEEDVPRHDEEASPGLHIATKDFASDVGEVGVCKEPERGWLNVDALAIPELGEQPSEGLTSGSDESENDAESKRNRVSKEIAAKMIEGWSLLDLSCPHCVMPLMTDGLGGQETCVLCGPVELEEEDSEEAQLEAPSREYRSLPDPSPRIKAPVTEYQSSEDESPTIEVPDGEEYRSMEDESPTIEASAREYQSSEDESPTIEVPDGEEYRSMEVVSPRSEQMLSPRSEASGRVLSPMLDSRRNDPPESDTLARDDPPASFFGADYNGGDGSPMASLKAPSPEASPRTASPRVQSAKPVSSLRAPRQRVEIPIVFDSGVDPILVCRSPEFEKLGLDMDLPDGVDMDDDLMSIAQSMGMATKEVFRPERSAPLDAVTSNLSMSNSMKSREVEFSSDHSVDNVSVMTGVTRNKSPARRPPGLRLKVGFEDDAENDIDTPKAGHKSPARHAMTTIGDAATKSKRRAPPRPGSSSGERARPPMSPGVGSNPPSPRRALPVAKKPTQSRRGPPRPEERGGGGRRRSNARSVSPQVSARRASAHVRDSLSLSLDHVRDRDDVSVISDGGYSKAETVATDALDTILTRIEECKAVLASTPKSEADFARQLEVAAMIEKLASAAVAVRKLEELGIN